MPEEAFYIEGIQVAKRGIALDVQKFFPDVTEIKFVETYKAEPKKQQPETTEPKKPKVEKRTRRTTKTKEKLETKT